jgi:hypothetical protein
MIRKGKMIADTLLADPDFFQREGFITEPRRSFQLRPTPPDAGAKVRKQPHRARRAGNVFNFCRRDFATFH